MVAPACSHVMLLEFVTAEHYQLFRPVLPQHHFHEFPAKRSRSTCNQNDLL
jgi:hypothetical protein